MTVDTGPFPVLSSQPVFGTSTADRLDVLVGMGAPIASGIWRNLPTADAVIDPGKGVLFIACDPEPSSEDWAVMCGLIAAVGWDNGSWPHSGDPGEPVREAGVDAWRLEYVRKCIWCDGHGTSEGCPLCRRVSLR